MDHVAVHLRQVHPRLDRFLGAIGDAGVPTSRILPVAVGVITAGFARQIGSYHVVRRGGGKLRNDEEIRKAKDYLGPFHGPVSLSGKG